MLSEEELFKKTEKLINKKSYVKTSIENIERCQDLMNKMLNYIVEEEYFKFDELKKIVLSDKKYVKTLKQISIDTSNLFDSNTLNDLLMFKCSNKIKPVLEIFEREERFNEEELELLPILKTSIKSLFKVIDSDYKGHIIVKDILTNRKYEVVDASLSLCFIPENMIYVYARMINFKKTNSFISILGLFTDFDHNAKKFINNSDIKHMSEVTLGFAIAFLSKDNFTNLVVNNSII